MIVCGFEHRYVQNDCLRGTSRREPHVVCGCGHEAVVSEPVYVLARELLFQSKVPVVYFPYAPGLPRRMRWRERIRAALVHLFTGHYPCDCRRR